MPKDKPRWLVALLLVVVLLVGVWAIYVKITASPKEAQYLSDVTLHRDEDGTVTTIDIQGQDLVFADVGEFTHAVVQLSGPWTVRKARDAYHGLCAWANASTPTGDNSRGADLSIAYIRPALPVAGRYDVYAWCCAPKIGGFDGNLEFRVHAKVGEVYQWMYVDPRVATGEWQKLGTFYIEPDGVVYVSNWDSAVVLDALRFVYRDDAREPATPPVPLPPPPFASPTPVL